MAEVISLRGIEFMNNYTRKMDTCTHDGYIFVAFRDPDDDGTFKQDGQTYRQDLGYGCISSHMGTNVESAREFIARLEGKNPEMVNRLEVVLAPCAFARRDSWKNILTQEQVDALNFEIRECEGLAASPETNDPSTAQRMLAKLRGRLAQAVVNG